MKIYADHLRKQLQTLVCCIVLFASGSCRSNSQAPRSRSLNLPAQSRQGGPEDRAMANVRLQKSERTDKLSFILKNETDHSIYVSYLPPDQGNTTTEFLAYGLERKTDEGDFKPSGEGFHFIPSLAPLAPKSAIEFAIIHPPKEPGEYRVIVGYSEDEAVVRLMREKGSNLTDAEKKQVDSQQRVVRSEFSVK
jgi:hypothetical protein